MVLLGGAERLDWEGDNRSQCLERVHTNRRRVSVVAISEVRGIGPVLEKTLAEHGFKSAEDMAAAKPESLSDVAGIGATSAPRLIAAAKAVAASEKPPMTKPAKVAEPKKVAKPAASVGKKASKSKKSNKKPEKKSKDKSVKKGKAKKKGKGKTSDKAGKKKSKKGKSSK